MLSGKRSTVLGHDGLFDRHPMKQKVVSMRLKRKANNKMLMKTPSPWVEDKMAAP